MSNQKLPIKTKIAVWWMIAIGGIAAVFGVFLLLSIFASGGGMDAGDAMGLAAGGIGAFAGLLFFFIPGIFILRRKR